MEKLQIVEYLLHKNVRKVKHFMSTCYLNYGNTKGLYIKCVALLKLYKTRIEETFKIKRKGNIKNQHLKFDS